jgi:hypothetical protein
MRLYRLRKNSALDRRAIPQGLILAAARQPDVFSIVYKAEFFRSF